MKIKVHQTKITREQVEVELDLPTETQYYFITGQRKSYKVVPEYVNIDEFTGKNEGDKLFKYNIVQVGLSFETVIRKFDLSVGSLPKHLEGGQGSKYYELARMITGQRKQGHRTKEDFEKDFQRAIDRMEI